MYCQLFRASSPQLSLSSFLAHFAFSPPIASGGSAALLFHRDTTPRIGSPNTNSIARASLRRSSPCGTRGSGRRAGGAGDPAGGNGQTREGPERRGDGARDRHGSKETGLRAPRGSTSCSGERVSREHFRSEGRDRARTHHPLGDQVGRQVGLCGRLSVCCACEIVARTHQGI